MMARRHGCWNAIRGTAALLSIGIAAPAWAGQIRLRPTAVVQGDMIRMADVADLTGFSLDQAVRLGDLTVSSAPQPGGEVFVHVAEIRTTLKSAAVNIAEVELLGFTRCRVSRQQAIHAKVEPPKATILPQRRHSPTERKAISERSSNPVTTATLETALREFINARLKEPNASVEIRFSPASRCDLDLDAASHQFDIHQKNDATLGLLSLEVAVTPIDGDVRIVPIVAEAVLLKQVVVAKKAINRGETLDAGRLRLEQRRFDDLGLVGITHTSAVIGQKARQLIQPGEMLSAKSVEPAPIIRRGEAVTIWMRQGGMLIKAGGRAQRDGALGDRIEVARDGSRRKQDLIEAVVTGPATVALGAASQMALATER